MTNDWNEIGWLNCIHKIYLLRFTYLWRLIHIAVKYCMYWFFYSKKFVYKNSHWWNTLTWKFSFNFNLHVFFKYIAVSKFNLYVVTHILNWNYSYLSGSMELATLNFQLVTHSPVNHNLQLPTTCSSSIVKTFKKRRPTCLPLS